MLTASTTPPTSAPPVTIQDVVLIHGIRTTYEESGLDCFHAPLIKAGLHIVPWTYRRESFMASWAAGDMDFERGGRLADYIYGLGPNKPHLIAHSNGCRMAAWAMHHGAQFGKVFFFAPAWKAKHPYAGLSFSQLWVMHSWIDWTVLLGALVPRHQFGDMGLRGYRGVADDRITNVNAWPARHSSYFNVASRDRWIKFAMERLRLVP